jgi:hypothetical protein
MAQNRHYSSTAKQASLSSSISSVATTITLDLVTGFPTSYPYSLVIDPDTNKEEIVKVTASGGGTSLTVVRGDDNTTNVTHSAGATVRHVVSAQDFTDFSSHLGSTASPTTTGVHGVSGTIVGTTDTQTLSAKTLTAPKFVNGGFIADDSGNEQIVFNKTTSAVNEFTVTNAATGNNPSLAATGGDTNISVNIVPKGSGTVQAAGVDLTTISGSQTLTNKTISLGSNTVTGTKAQFNSAMSDADFATLAGSETLTGKTINLTDNTLSGTVAQFNTALSDDNFVTLTGSETLTNKTITSPIVTGLTLNDSSIVFEGSSADTNETTLTVTDPTADRTITFPDATGTVTLDGVASTLTSKTITSGTLGSDLAAGGYKVTGLGTPTSGGDAATKTYADTKLALSGGTMTGAIDLGTNKITNLGTPSASGDAATKGYVDTQVSNLVDAAPGALDTLNELAAAINDDANFSTTITNSIATKLSLSGGTMTGAIAMGTNKITGLGTPTSSADAATKDYADGKLALTGGTLSGNLSLGNNKITSLGDPSASSDAVNKSYIDTLFGSTSSAATSATSAANSASAAATSATSASTSASSASTSASSAQTSATSAANSASAAAASYDSFDDRYLGAKSTAPNLDNDGDALIVGATYWDTPLSTMYAWSGSAWIAISATSAVASVAGTADRITSTGGSTPIINIASAYDDERIVVDLMDIY